MSCECVRRKVGRQAGLKVAYSSENGSAALLMLVWEGVWGVFVVGLGSFKKHLLFLSQPIIQNTALQSKHCPFSSSSQILNLSKRNIFSYVLRDTY